MPSFCVVSNCEYKYERSKNISFHKFPHTSKELLKKWIKFTDRGPYWKPSRWSAICSRHFLPSDFRPTKPYTRKCLRRDAVPSVTIKNFGVNLLDFRQHNNEDRQAIDEGEQEDISEKEPITESLDSNCRLCGLCCKGVATFSSNFEVFAMIQKCFPSLNIQLDDNLPKDLCSKCLEHLEKFSKFIDNVLKIQKKFEKRLTTRNHTNTIINSEKTIKIKQEPTIKIKQEINEGIQNNCTNQDVNIGIENQQQIIDEKSQIPSKFPSFINSQEIVNNCDIMEIISLDDAFIDIPDDENGGNEEESNIEFKVSCNQIKIYPLEEHNYCKIIENNEDVGINDYKIVKQEELDIPMITSNTKTTMAPIESLNSNLDSLTAEKDPATSIAIATISQNNESKKSNKDILVINESIVKPIPAYDLYYCDYCPMQFLTNETLMEHKKSNHDFHENVCSICQAKFKTFYGFLRHKIIVHSKKVKFFKKRTDIHACLMCKQRFTTKVAFNNHKKYICKYPEKKFYNCKYCNKKLEKWILLRKHERDCKLQLKGQRTDGKGKPIENRIQNESGKYSCRQCSRTYQSQRNLRQHENSHRPLDQWNYKCGNCQKFFDFSHDLRSHLKKRECKAAPAGAEHIYFVCGTCGNEFKSLTKLKWHNLIHTGLKPLVCETCGKAFRSYNNLYQHRITHTNIRRHKCDLCDKTFKRTGGLNQHKRAFHFRLKPHECEICKHRYALKNDMIRCRHSDLKDKFRRKV